MQGVRVNILFNYALPVCLRLFSLREAGKFWHDQSESRLREPRQKFFFSFPGIVFARRAELGTVLCALHRGAAGVELSIMSAACERRESLLSRDLFLAGAAEAFAAGNVLQWCWGRRRDYSRMGIFDFFQRIEIFCMFWKVKWEVICSKGVTDLTIESCDTRGENLYLPISTHTHTVLWVKRKHK